MLLAPPALEALTGGVLRSWLAGMPPHALHGY
jgi:hypothetical protein